MKRVFITGVAGFIGSNVAHQFHVAGWQVFGLDTHSRENAPLEDLFKYYQIVLPSAEIGTVISEVQPEVCVHCAGRASVDLSMADPRADFEASVDVTFDLLDGLRRYAPTCRMIYLSSAAVYGNPDYLPVKETDDLRPISPYGFHKLMCEQLCKEFHKIYGISVARVRIFSAYGTGLRRQVLWDVCQKALTQPVVYLRGTGDESRDFIHVLDIARAIYFLAEHAGFKDEVYNLASGLETSIRTLTDLILKQLTGNISPKVVFDGKESVGMPLHWKADMNHLLNLGFTPAISLEQGISAYVRWCKAEKSE